MEHDLAVVTGAGGFIGGHLVKRLLDEGMRVQAVDRKSPEEWWQIHERANTLTDFDISHPEYARVATEGADEVYHLAADMGGMGFITNNKLDCMLSVESSTAVLKQSYRNGASRFFYSSSACVYPAYKQNRAYGVALKEDDAYPADAEDGYGWEKLFTERMCRHFREDVGYATRVARYHNVYGPHGTWTGGREKAPAALCRKVAAAQITGAKHIEVWGDGLATRSFMHVDDCVEGTLRIMRGEHADPINLGSDYLLTVNELARTVMEIAGLDLAIEHVEGPQGVRGRCSDNTKIREVYDWEPKIDLLDGLERTYAWIFDQVSAEYSR